MPAGVCPATLYYCTFVCLQPAKIPSGAANPGCSRLSGGFFVHARHHAGRGPLIHARSSLRLAATYYCASVCLQAAKILGLAEKAFSRRGCRDRKDDRGGPRLCFGFLCVLCGLCATLVFQTVDDAVKFPSAISVCGVSHLSACRPRRIGRRNEPRPLGSDLAERVNPDFSLRRAAMDYCGFVCLQAAKILGSAEKRFFLAEDAEIAKKTKEPPRLCLVFFASLAAFARNYTSRPLTMSESPSRAIFSLRRAAMDYCGFVCLQAAKILGSAEKRFFLAEDAEIAKKTKEPPRLCLVFFASLAAFARNYSSRPLTISVNPSRAIFSLRRAALWGSQSWLPPAFSRRLAFVPNPYRSQPPCA
jgi:hypothetical protein